MLKTMHAEAVTWTESPNFCAFLSAVSGKKSSWDAFTQTFSILFIWKAYKLKKNILEKVFFAPPGKLEGSYIWNVAHRMWRIAIKEDNISSPRLAIIIINHPNAPNCQMRPFAVWSVLFVRG